jgi:hypothetical protein
MSFRPQMRKKTPTVLYRDSLNKNQPDNEIEQAKNTFWKLDQFPSSNEEKPLLSKDP